MKGAPPNPYPGRAVTFDFGQVLASLDPAYLAEKLAAHRIVVGVPLLEAAMPAGWEAYGRALSQGGHGGTAWKTFLRTVIEGAGQRAPEEVLDFLFRDQRPRNLWRRPVPGMIEVARALSARGVPVGIVSNSEGALSTLVASLGWTSDFPIVADSGHLGMEKPGAAIFAWTAERLGVPSAGLVHIGDSWAADVCGALALGAHAVWFIEGERDPVPLRDDDGQARLSVAHDAAGVQRAVDAALANFPPGARRRSLQ